MNKSTIAIFTLVTIFVVAMGGLTLAIQDRRPVDPPTPTPSEPTCPEITADDWCGGSGVASDKVFAWALSSAGTACQHELNDCFTDQATELAANKATCEAVAGCTLKYTVDYDTCEMGNYKNCTPLPGTVVEDKNTTYTCTIKGHYDIEGYRCDRGPSSEGEQQA